MINAVGPDWKETMPRAGDHGFGVAEMYVALPVIAGRLFWAGATLIIDGYLRRPDPADWLRP